MCWRPTCAGWWKSAANTASAGGRTRRPTSRPRSPAGELEAGAIGVTCAKLGEAEVMAGAGIEGILVANQVVGPLEDAPPGRTAAARRSDPDRRSSGPARPAERSRRQRRRAAARDRRSRYRPAPRRHGRPASRRSPWPGRSPRCRTCSWTGSWATRGTCCSWRIRRTRTGKIREAIGLLVETRDAICCGPGCRARSSAPAAPARLPRPSRARESPKCRPAG